LGNQLAMNNNDWQKSIKLLTWAFCLLLLTGMLVLGGFLGSAVRAYSEMTGSNFKIKDPALDVGGGVGTSGSYKLNQALGQEFQNRKTGSNYKIYEGIMYYPGTLSISCGTSVNIPEVTPGSPQNITDICTITTDSANGYQLYAYENKDLEHNDSPGTYITPSGLGSYDNPTPWDTGTDVGLGFSLSGTSAEAKWNSGGNFSSFVSGTAGLVNNYSSASAQGTNLTVIYQLDVAGSQMSGSYSNEVYYYVTTNWF